ncbi:MAG: DUF4234 domain-containing protein [Clostridia bacterium]|nr:DUF4234 domain-containing protein [Clostridia bacterium]
MIQQRNVAVAILLSIVTCGIYGIYWFIVLSDDVGKANNNPNISGGVAFLLNLVTCGIYGMYWSYKLGKEMYEANQKHGIAAKDNSVLYLILAIFGFQIVNWAIIQSELNKIATNSTTQA